MVLDLVPHSECWGQPRAIAESVAAQAAMVLGPILTTALSAYLVVRPADELRTLGNRTLRLGALGVGLCVHAIALMWRYPIPGVLSSGARFGPAGQGKEFGDSVARHFGAAFFLAVNVCRLVVWAFVSHPPEPYQTLLRLRSQSTTALDGKSMANWGKDRNKEFRPSEPSLPLWVDLSINLAGSPRGPRLSVFSAAQGVSK